MIEKVILGTAQLGLDYGINNYGKLSKKESFRILDYAFDNKIKFLDTAESYGNSIELLASFFKKNPGKRFGIFSKLDLKDTRVIKNTKSHLKSILAKMNLETIHGYMIHNFSDLKKFPEVLDNLIELKKIGLINNVGVSLYKEEEIEDVISNYEVDFIQIPFNLLDNQCEKIDIFKKINDKGVEIHARSIFLQGLFFKPYDKYSNQLKPLVKYMKIVDKIIRESNSNIETLAINYPLKKDYINKVIFGVHNLRQFNKNIKIINSRHELDLDKIDLINVKEKELLKPYNWK